MLDLNMTASSITATVKALLWAWPYVWFALPLPLLAWFALPRRRGVTGRALRVPDLSPYEDFVEDASKSSHRFSLLLLSLMWVLLVAATARPQSFGDPLQVPVNGRDLMLCIDISGSMNEPDIYAGNQRATRMAVVKAVARGFVAERTGDRIGLIMFGSNAYVQTPLTLDHKTVQHFLDEATVGLAGRSTAIGDAIGLGVKRLRSRPEASRVLILLTDGENSAGVVDPIEAASLAAQNDIRIHTIGIGSGRRGRNELDERSLTEIATVTGGRYFRARNQQELETIYGEIDRLEPTDDDGEQYRPLLEWYQWPLAGALICSLLWALFRHGGSSTRMAS